MLKDLSEEKGRAEGSEGDEAGKKQHRCHCGQLLACITASGVELKCRRCKRIQVVPWTMAKAAGR